MPRPSFPPNGPINEAIAAIGYQVTKSLSLNYGEPAAASPDLYELRIDAAEGTILQRIESTLGQFWTPIGIPGRRWLGAPVFTQGHTGLNVSANFSPTVPGTGNRITIGLGKGFSDPVMSTAKWLDSSFKSSGSPITKQFQPTQPWAPGFLGNARGPSVNLGAGRTALTVAAIRQERTDKVDTGAIDIILINAGTYPVSFNQNVNVLPVSTNFSDRWQYVANLGTVIWDAPSATFLQTQQVGSKTFLRGVLPYIVNFPSGSLTQIPMLDLPLPSTAEVECIASLPPTTGSLSFSSGGSLVAVNEANARVATTIRLAGSATITASAAVNDLRLWPISYTELLNKLPNNY
jgi:hypothetical protein